MLTSERAIADLRARDLITARDLVDGSVRVETMIGRNRNFRVTLDAGRGWLLKEAWGDDPAGGAGLAREAALYERAGNSPEWRTLRDLVPRMGGFDRERGILTLELVDGASNAHELDDAGGPVAYPAIGALLGAALAVVHALPLAPGDSASDTLPWILDVARPAPGWLRDLTEAQLELIRQVQRDDAVAGALGRMREGWARTALIHGDVKWGNVLVRTDPATHAPARVWLIDWESAGPGDPAWDVGSAFHSLLADALHVAAAESSSAAAAAAAFAAALPRVREEIRSTWRAYAQARGARLGAGFARRATEACGARLLQSAYEWCHGESTVPRDALTALQLGVNVLRAPDAARRDLLAIDDHAGAGNG